VGGRLPPILARKIIASIKLLDDACRQEPRLSQTQ
jgi:hypothetical protein